MSYKCAKFEENPCVGTDESTPFAKRLLKQKFRSFLQMTFCGVFRNFVVWLKPRGLKHSTLHGNLVKFQNLKRFKRNLMNLSFFTKK